MTDLRPRPWVGDCFVIVLATKMLTQGVLGCAGEVGAIANPYMVLAEGTRGISQD